VTEEIPHVDDADRVEVSGQAEDGRRYGTDGHHDRPGDDDQVGRRRVVDGVADDAGGDGADGVGAGEPDRAARVGAGQRKELEQGRERLLAE
jgi:hypothetical protein